jgi:rubrerythrin
MPLENFGSILNFAEELESQDQSFYEAAGKNPGLSALAPQLAQLAAEAGKNVKTVQRIRRENVTEMILEPVKDFTRAPFCEACEGAVILGAAEVLETAKRLEARAERYYAEAAEKIRAQPEVARALKSLGKIRRARHSKLDALKP